MLARRGCWPSGGRTVTSNCELWSDVVPKNAYCEIAPLQRHDQDESCQRKVSEDAPSALHPDWDLRQATVVDTTTASSALDWPLQNSASQSLLAKEMQVGHHPAAPIRQSGRPTLEV